MIKNILAIDDSASMRQILAATFTAAGYDVTVAADGTADTALTGCNTTADGAQTSCTTTADGGHTGYNSIGLRTPLADQCVGTVIITSRLSGLWECWHEGVTREAERIGRRVIRTFGVR